jgi:hypothetical protein
VQLLRSSPLFKDADDGFVHAICHFMTEEFYLKGDLVYQKGDPADALCFVGYGTEAFCAARRCGLLGARYVLPYGWVGGRFLCTAVR